MSKYILTTILYIMLNLYLHTLYIHNKARDCYKLCVTCNCFNLLLLTLKSEEVNVKMIRLLIEFTVENNIEFNENLNLEIVTNFEKV